MIKKTIENHEITSKVKSLGYSTLKQNVMDHIKSKAIYIGSFQGTERRKVAQDIIEEYISNKRPMVSEFVYNDSMDYAMLSHKLVTDILDYKDLTPELTHPTFTDIELFNLGKGGLVGIKNNKPYPILNDKGEEIYFSYADDVREFITKLSFGTEERLSLSRPIMRCETLQGYRLTAQDESVTGTVIDIDGNEVRCPLFSIRLKQPEPISLKEMIEDKKSLTNEMYLALKMFSECPATNIFYSGVPGTGKTTLMNEMTYETLNLTKAYISRTKEYDGNRRDKNGKLLQHIKVWIANKDDSDDVYSATVKNFYYASLSTRLNVIILGESRTTSEMLTVLESTVSGTSVWTTLHGADEETTFERVVKNTMEAKSMDRYSAISEVLLSMHIIVNMSFAYEDGQVRVAKISEVLRGEDNLGHPKPIFKPIFEYHEEDNTFYKVNFPTFKRLKRTKRNAKAYDFLYTECSPEHPIALKGDKYCDIL